MSKLNLALLKARRESFENKGKSKNANIFWKPEPGTQIVRIVPYKFAPDWPFIELKFYYKLAGKNYLAPCTFGKPDPIQDYVDKLKKTYDKKNYALARMLEAKPRTYAPVIVRGKEKEGVKFWGFGVNVYNSILKIMEDVDYGDITDIESGHDITVEFKTADQTGKDFPETTILAKPRKTPAVDQGLIQVLSNQTELVTVWEVPTVETLISAMGEYIKQVTKSPDGVAEPTQANVVGDDTPVTTQLDSPSAVQASENAEEAANEFQHFFDETEKKEESPAAEAPATQ